MAGIAGYLGIKDRKLLDTMINTLRYTNNEIVDVYKKDDLLISRVHHGIVNTETQPIFNEDKSMFIVMVGEVFDYEDKKKELIQKGHKFKFRRNSAEYCLHLYEELGKKSFEELNGSFCILLYDLKNKEILLVSDRFSSWPLYYFYIGSKLFFSTELSSLLESLDIPRDLDICSIFEFFNFQTILGTKTFYKNIKIIPFANILSYSNGKINLERYWELRYKNKDYSKKEYVKRLYKTLKNCIVRRLDGDHKFGLLLSGGLDSRAVLAAGNNKGMVTFTFGHSKNDLEVEIAKKIAKTGNQEHLFLKIPDYTLDKIDLAIISGNGMFNFIHAPTLPFSNIIRENCEVLLHGWAPEIPFRGLDLPRKELHFLGKKLRIQFLDRISEKKLPYLILNKPKYSNFHRNPNQIFNYDNFDTSLINSVKSILEESDEKNLYNKYDYLINGYLFKYPSFLNVSSLRSYIDERTFIFDNDLFDVYLEMPPKLRLGNEIWNKALMKLNHKIAAITDANTNCSPSVPYYLEFIVILYKRVFKKINSKVHPIISSKNKENFKYDFAELIRYDENMKSIISSTINDPECINPSIFNVPRIKEIFNEHMENKDNYASFLFLLLTFGRWHKKYGPRS